MEGAAVADLPQGRRWAERADGARKAACERIVVEGIRRRPPSSCAQASSSGRTTDGPVHLLAAPCRTRRRGAAPGSPEDPVQFIDVAISRAGSEGDGRRRRRDVQRHGRDDALRRPAGKSAARSAGATRPTRGSPVTGGYSPRRGRAERMGLPLWPCLPLAEYAGIQQASVKRRAQDVARGHSPTRSGRPRRRRACRRRRPPPERERELLGLDRAGREARPLRAPRVVAANAVRVDAAMVGEVDRQPLKGTTSTTGWRVGTRVTRADRLERRDGLAALAPPPALSLQDEGAHTLVHRRQVAVK